MSLSKSRFHNYRSLRPLTATRDLANYSQFGGSGLYYAGTVYWGCHHRQELVQPPSGCRSQAAGTGTSTVVDCALINSVPYTVHRTAYCKGITSPASGPPLKITKKKMTTPLRPNKHHTQMPAVSPLSLAGKETWRTPPMTYRFYTFLFMGQKRRGLQARYRWGTICTVLIHGPKRQRVTKWNT